MIRLCALVYAVSSNTFTSAPIASPNRSPNICNSYGSLSVFIEIGLKFSLMPYFTIIFFAISVATSISLLAPVDISFNAIFSAALPPKRATNFSSISVFEI